MMKTEVETLQTVINWPGIENFRSLPGRHFGAFGLYGADEIS